MIEVAQPVSFPSWLAENQRLLKPPVGNKQMFPTGSDFIVMVVGGPNQRTDYHVDPYEEFFYQVKGNMHLNVMTPDGPDTIHIGEGDMWVLPGRMPHSPQRPEAGSIGLPRVRQRGARGRATGARHRRRPAAAVPGVLRRRGRAHLRQVRHPPPRSRVRRAGVGAA
jgi:3-hydroxyanthranilate 3,4-dioxygenase